MIRKEYDGYITVYLALTLGIMISLITTMLAGARMRTVRFQTECVTDIGLESIFAEYHREMLNRYGLLFIDSSYGTGSGSEEAVKSHLLHYMNLNFDAVKKNMAGRDLTASHADNAVIDGVAFATDGRGSVLDYQIDRYMKVKYGLGYIPVFKNDTEDLNSYLDQYEDYHSSRESAHGTVDSLIEEYNSQLPEDEEPYSISNPADSVEDLSDSNVLFYALGDTSGMPFRSTDPGLLISHRSYREGAGLRDYQEVPKGMTFKALLIDYIYDKCGYYKNEKPDTALSYEIEYILEGKGSDIENMESIATKIFKIRYAVNMAYLLSNDEKKAEAEALALAATAAIGQPELEDAVTYTILFAWGYAESAKDIRILYDGHGLTMIKTDATWNTPLAILVDFKAHLSEYVPPEGNMDYKKFLDIFLAAKSIEDINFGLMDIMEADIRRSPGNCGFKIDDQVYQLFADINVSSGYGYGCSIRRFYSYE